MESIIELTLVPLVLLIVQALKTVRPQLDAYAVAVVLVVAGLLSTILVDWTSGWQTSILEMLTYTVMIASGASGVYSWSKNKSKDGMAGL